MKQRDFDIEDCTDEKEGTEDRPLASWGWDRSIPPGHDAVEGAAEVPVVGIGGAGDGGQE